jgi:RHS repeat-associated protein
MSFHSEVAKQPHHSTLLITEPGDTVLATTRANSRRAYTAFGYVYSAPQEGAAYRGCMVENPGFYLLGNGTRSFNPSLMRFQSSDNLSPFGQGGINSYAYCSGDPINNIDPSGHSWLKPFIDFIAKQKEVLEFASGLTTITKKAPKAIERIIGLLPARHAKAISKSLPIDDAVRKNLQAKSDEILKQLITQEKSDEELAHLIMQIRNGNITGVTEQTIHRKKLYKRFGKGSELLVLDRKYRVGLRKAREQALTEQEALREARKQFFAQWKASRKMRLFNDPS